MKTGRENGVVPMGEKVRHSHIQSDPNLITTVWQLSAGKFLILFHGYMIASTATSCIILLRNIEEKQSQHGKGLHFPKGKYQNSLQPQHWYQWFWPPEHVIIYIRGLILISNHEGGLILSNTIKFMQSNYKYRVQTVWVTLFEPVSATVTALGR